MANNDDKDLQNNKNYIHADDLDDIVEDAIEDALEEAEAKDTTLDKIRSVIVIIAATMIALGEYTEAITLIGDGIESVKQKFTNTVDYEKISNIHVGNTVAYVEELLGNPQVSKTISPTITANYFYHDKYLLTMYYSEDRITAFTVITLDNDFQPQISRGSNLDLGSFTYSEFPGTTVGNSVDHSKVFSLYLEDISQGQAGMFLKTYMGNIEYGAFEQNKQLLADLYQKGVYGTDEEIAELQIKYRSSTKPNLFGYGEIPLELIEKGLLTTGQFTSYINK